MSCLCGEQQCNGILNGSDHQQLHPVESFFWLFTRPVLNIVALRKDEFRCIFASTKNLLKTWNKTWFSSSLKYKHHFFVFDSLLFSLLCTFQGCYWNDVIVYGRDSDLRLFKFALHPFRFLWNNLHIFKSLDAIVSSSKVSAQSPKKPFA